MKRTTFALMGFFLLCVFNLFAEWNGTKMMIFATKPLLMISLSVWYYWKVEKPLIRFHRLILLGFFFSFLGDTFLMFVENDPPRESFFILGLVSFLITHICYLIAFLSFPSIKKGLVRQQYLWVVPFLILLIGNVWMLWTGIPEALRLPVFIYSSAIIGMALSALNLKGKATNKTFQWIFIGALLFVISDTLIGINKFRGGQFSIPMVRIWIMLFYLTGQFLMAKGGSMVRSSDAVALNPSPKT